jgi:hypothetical protein
MRFKSQAQRRKFAELLVKGEISPETFEGWNRDTGSAKLPERVKPATKKRRSRRTKAKAGKPRSKTRATTRRASKSRAKSKKKSKRARR